MFAPQSNSGDSGEYGIGFSTLNIGEISMAKPPKKESGNKASSIAGKVLAGKKPTPKEVKTLAGSVLSQDETKGKRKPR